MNQEEIIQDAFDQLLHEQRVSNKGFIETISTETTRLSATCRTDGWSNASPLHLIPQGCPSLLAHPFVSTTTKAS